MGMLWDYFPQKQISHEFWNAMKQIKLTSIPTIRGVSIAVIVEAYKV
jgi:hypothetical protein